MLFNEICRFVQRNLAKIYCGFFRARFGAKKINNFNTFYRWGARKKPNGFFRAHF